MTSKHTDIAIIGGGIIGCAIAYYLRKNYRVDVAVFEKEEIGKQASSAAAGLLAPLGPLSGPGPFADLLLAGFTMFPDLVSELESESGINLGYEQIGALRTTSNPKRIAHLRKRMDVWRPLGLQMLWLTGEEAREIEPGLSKAICAAVYVPEESQIQAPSVVQAFHQIADQYGVHFYPDTEIVSIQRRGFQATGFYSQRDEFISCNHIVIAAGAWSERCGLWFDSSSLPVSPLKGQMISYERSSSPSHIIFGGSAYISPRKKAILVGATKEKANFDTQITEEGRVWLQSTAERLVPSLGNQPIIKSWAGLRPKTPDTRPILGPLDEWNNVTVATGHNSVGIMLSAITGKTIADLVVAGRAAEIILPFFPREMSTEPKLASVSQTGY